jgi:uncharacterized membrane protein
VIVLNEEQKREFDYDKYSRYGLVFGVVSIPFFYFFIFPILAVFCSILALVKYDKRKHKNAWMPFAGLVLGLVFFVIGTSFLLAVSGSFLALLPILLAFLFFMAAVGIPIWIGKLIVKRLKK